MDEKDGKTKKPQDAKAKNGQRHRLRRRRNYTLFYILLAAFIVGGGVYLSLTMLFNLEEINVAGNTRYDKAQIIETAGVKLGENLFKVDTKKVENRLMLEYSYIETVEVRRQFPTKLLISIIEAQPKAALEEADGYTLISESGKVLERSLAQPPEGMLTVRGIGTALAGEEDAHRLELLYELLAVMEELAMEGYDFIDLSDTLEIVMICGDRLRVELGNELELPYKLQFVDEVVREKIDDTGFMLIDASTPGEVMTKTMTISPWDTITSSSPQVVTDDEEE